ncbi:MAG: hypothetical protein DRN78_00185 [Thermoproteota archaeon]|nr:MAG: hypothetical protein DRN78_00185 [Candidatus Korarchaeota archaeon]
MTRGLAAKGLLPPDIAKFSGWEISVYEFPDGKLVIGFGAEPPGSAAAYGMAFVRQDEERGGLFGSEHDSVAAEACLAGFLEGLSGIVLEEEDFGERGRNVPVRYLIRASPSLRRIYYACKDKGIEERKLISKHPRWAKDIIEVDLGKLRD